jgi:integral membrane protein
MKNLTLIRFTQIAFIEGVSTVILFFIAMPLKYLADWPLGVTYVGWLHGLLFVAYLILLVSCWYIYKWSFKRVALFFFASLIPFAPFIVERQLKKEMKANAIMN